jgi:hypothetical protein
LEQFSFIYFPILTILRNEVPHNLLDFMAEYPTAYPSKRLLIDENSGKTKSQGCAPALMTESKTAGL